MTNVPRFFSVDERQQTLDTLVNAFKRDNRIAGVIIVGSGAVGFDDEYSDIDLSIVVADKTNTKSVYDSWQSKIEDLFNVVHCFKTIYGENNFLYGFLLHNYLELDIGFLNLSNLVAKKPRWRIIHDPVGKVLTRMQESEANSVFPIVQDVYQRHLDSIWHYILHTVICAKRGQFWRAIHYLEEVRNRAVEIACLSRGLTANHYRQVDQLPDELLRKMQKTLVTNVNERNILNSAKCTAEIFFDEANYLEKELKLSIVPQLENHMVQLFQIFSVH